MRFCLLPGTTCCSDIVNSLRLPTLKAAKGRRELRKVPCRLCDVSMLKGWRWPTEMRSKFGLNLTLYITYSYVFNIYMCLKHVLNLSGLCLTGVFLLFGPLSSSNPALISLMTLIVHKLSVAPLDSSPKKLLRQSP